MLLIFISLIGGLGLFIYGMNLMSRGIERVAGSKLRDILRSLTRNKFLGLVVGLFFTAVIQSSSAATAMVVSFVNSGLMTLAEASGVILGANIGTTITALLVAFRLSAAAPVFIFAGAIMANYVKKPIVKKAGDIVIGFGILFLGVNLMSDAMGQMREMPAVIDLFSHFTNPFLAVLMGFVITSVVQSSSVTVSILVVMASQGLVDLHIAMFVILGCNIGACASAVIASIGGTKNGKRAALIHLLFNVLSTVLLFVLITFFGNTVESVIHFVSGTGSDAASLGRNIAIAHLLFKVFSVIVFYPLTGLIIRLAQLIVPGEDETDADGKFVTRFIGSTNLPNPAIAIYLAVQEIYRMAHMAKDNLNRAMEALYIPEGESSTAIHETELYIDFLNIKISDYLVQINQNTLPLADQSKISGFFHAVSDIERIGDYADNVREAAVQLSENNISFSEESIGELKQMMGNVNRMIDDALEMFGEGNEEHMAEISALEEEVDEMEKRFQDRHIERLNAGLCSAAAGIYFSDIVTALERVADHAINIAFSVSETKNDKKYEEFEEMGALPAGKIKLR
ncbi:MAG: Na/Pi cotransporter family protein [Lachnospiraceae bacterium]|nr:Na/Pi cotransporter family protein [Lachnospiraceae bacterium]